MGALDKWRDVVYSGHTRDLMLALEKAMEDPGITHFDYAGPNQTVHIEWRKSEY